MAAKNFVFPISDEAVFLKTSYISTQGNVISVSFDGNNSLGQIITVSTGTPGSGGGGFKSPFRTPIIKH